VPVAAHVDRVSAARKEWRMRMVVGKYSLDVAMISCALRGIRGIVPRLL
jgi:hypothetical protein